MKQVVVIHGGTTYANYETYLNDLASKKLYVDRMTFKPMWKELLQENLGNDYQVLLPSMPNKTNARYEEWETWFTHLTEIIEDDCVLIGHSLGAIFLAKYLSTHKLLVKIKATILVAAPFDDESIEDLTHFKLDAITDLFTQQAGKVICFFGTNDPVISLQDAQKYQNALPNAEFRMLPAPDHFVRQDFPELITAISQL